MDEAETVTGIVDSREDYVAQRIRAGQAAEVATARAEAQYAEYLPDGHPAPGHRLWAVEDERGARIGLVWVGPHPDRPDDPTMAWLFSIEVDAAFRGRGHGRETLEALETELVRTGVTELGLNVFGGNDTARRLYATSGYQERAVSMSKKLSKKPA